MPVPMTLPAECPTTFDELRRVVRAATVQVARHRGFDCLAMFIENMQPDDLVGLLLALSGDTDEIDNRRMAAHPHTCLRQIRVEQEDPTVIERAEWAACHVGALRDSTMAEFLNQTLYAYPSNEADYESASWEWGDFAHDVDQILARPGDEAHYLIIGGDWGGQAYLTVPNRLVRCSEDTLLKIGLTLNRLCWGEGEDGLFIERRPSYTGFYGMGGAGYNHRGLWLTGELESHRDDLERVILRDAPLVSLHTLPYPEPPHVEANDRPTLG